MNISHSGSALDRFMYLCRSVFAMVFLPGDTYVQQTVQTMANNDH
ncbi:hypothetical protein [Marinococcus sp. PL1-022]|nr:hypothetical protein [Marinococcus sp. PL1-022]MDX6152598.1 hypothetical protein [Marinococcus sp. PL1-022]